MRGKLQELVGYAIPRTAGLRRLQLHLHRVSHLHVRACSGIKVAIPEDTVGPFTKDGFQQDCGTTTYCITLETPNTLIICSLPPLPPPGTNLGKH